MQAEITGYGRAHARRQATLQRTRRFALVGVVAAALALFLATGATFTATNDSVTLSPAAATSASTITKNDATLSGGQLWPTSLATTATLPSWTPTLNTVVGTTAGDLAIANTLTAGTGTQIITVALGNAGALNKDYSYMMLPVTLVEQTTAGGTWSAVSAYPSTVYLSLTNGYLNFFVPGGKYYGIKIGAGGSIYTISTTATGGSLSPVFNVSVTAG